MIVLASSTGGFGLPLGLTLALMAGLLFFSFLFSGTETALFSLQKLERARLEASGGVGERLVRLLEDRGALITTILIGNETVNITLAATGAEVFEGMTPYPWLDPWLNVLVLTPTLVLLSEITPKVLAFRFNIRWARLIAWPLQLFAWLVTPLRWLVSGFVGLLGASLFGVTANESDEGLGEAELLNLVDQGTAAGSFQERERELIENVFEFDDLSVGRLMTPRPDIVSLAADTPWDELLAACKDHGFSRVPIYGTDAEDILGILLLKDLLKHRDRPLAGPRQLRSLLLPPTFVPSSKPAADMLAEFLKHQQHMAFVVDEHGTLVGLLTLDDLLSELFGEMPDKDDEDDVAIERHASGAFTVQASMDAEDFADHTGVELPEGDYHTVGGWVFHQLGRLPHRGDAFTWQGHRFVVRTMEGRRIHEVLVRLAPGTTVPLARAQDGSR